MGEFSGNDPHGYGLFITPEGDKYAGEWLNGKKHGYGVYNSMNGSIYEG